MDTLPPEIITQILETFPIEQGPRTGSRRRRAFRPEIARYSSISRVWNASIERLTFRGLTICTDELDAFAATFGGGKISRRAALTSLTVVFILPDPANPMGCCSVTRTLDREADSVMFSSAVVRLFAILSDLESRSIEKRPLSLIFLEGWRISKSAEPRGTTRVPCRPTDHHRYQHDIRKVKEAEAISGEFALLHIGDVPTVHGITILDYKGTHELSSLRPTWIPAIVERLPDLEELLVWREDRYSLGRHERHARRECLSASIRSLIGNNLRKIQLDVRHEPMRNETCTVHKLVESHQWTRESWFCLFNHLATLPNLAVLHLLGGITICPEFFRGIVDSTSTPFPALEDFELQFAPETADGRWFYKGDDEAIERSRNNPKDKKIWKEIEGERAREERCRRYNEGELDYCDYFPVFGDGPSTLGVVNRNRFRSVPDTETFLPLLMDAEKAVQRMPNIRKFILKQGHKFSKHFELDYTPIVSRVFELWYLKAGTHRSKDKVPTYYDPSVPRDAAYLNRNRLYWRVDRWKPWDEAQAAWGAFAGPEAKVVFLEEDKWTSFCGWASHQVYEGSF